MGPQINPMCKAEWHPFPEISPTPPFSKQDTYCTLKPNSSVIYMTSTKTNSIYPTRIQTKTQTNHLLIRHVSALVSTKYSALTFATMLAVEASQTEI